MSSQTGRRIRFGQYSLEGMGHWPMFKAPDALCAVIADDIGRLQHFQAHDARSRRESAAQLT
jgi:hypothetical protein